MSSDSGTATLEPAAISNRFPAHAPVANNVKEHATLSAGAHVDHRVDVETTVNHVNRTADRGCCVSALLLDVSGNFDFLRNAMMYCRASRFVEMRSFP
jgi:hypothetical protein